MKKWLIVLLIVATHLNAKAQLNPVKNLVFEGAGVRGIAYCGAMQELESRGLMQHVERVGGTSAGAIMALTISLGYTAEEIAKIISKTNFKKFNDGRFIFIGGINRTNKYFGWYRSYKFEKWLQKIIVAKTGNADITFGELHQNNFKDLYVTGTCINKQQLFIFSNENYPEMKVKDAIRISMSIPLYFEPVFIDEKGKLIHHPRQKKELDVFVDGGVLGNFPIRMFDSTRYISKSQINSFMVNPGTLGFRIDSDDQIKNDKEGKQLAAMQVSSLKEYILAFYNLVNENLNRQLLTQQDWKRTVSISDKKIGPRPKIKLSAFEAETLMQSGRESVRNIFVNNK
jgi:NTE family protein